MTTRRLTLCGVLILLTLVIVWSVAPDPFADPVRVVARYGGRPVTAQWGERIRVEGKMRRTMTGQYLLATKVGEGQRDDCVLLRGVEDWWRPMRWRATALTFSSHIATVTGTPTEPLPRYPTPNGGFHQSASCHFAMQVEAIDL